MKKERYNFTSAREITSTGVINLNQQSLTVTADILTEFECGKIFMAWVNKY